MGTPKLWKKILLFLGFIILFLFFYSLNQENSITFFSQIRNKNIFVTVLTALTLTILNIIVKGHRWQMLIKHISKKEISFAFSLKSIISGVAASSIIPGRMEVAKPVLLKSEYAIPFNESIPSLFIERVLDLLSIIIILLSSLFFLPSLGTISISLVTIAIVAFTTSIILLLYQPSMYLPIIKKIITILPLSQPTKQKISEFTQKSIENITLFKSRHLVSFLILSLIANGLEVIRFYSIASLIGLPLSLAIVGFAFTGSTILGIISAIPGGIGITEFSSTTIIKNISALSHTNDNLIKISVLVDRLIAYYLLIIVGSLLLVTYRKNSPNGELK